MSSETEADTTISGTCRAAIFLMTLGEKPASEVLKHLRPKEVQNIGVVMAEMPAISRAKLMEVIETFTERVYDQTALGVGSQQYLKKILTMALGDDRARSLIDRVLVGSNGAGLESLKWMDGRAVAELIRNEHPQIMAVVVSCLDSDHGAEVLKFLPERARSDVIMRIASLESIHPSALDELNQVIERQFYGNSAATVVGGLKRAVSILNMMDSSSENAILDSICESDAVLGKRLQDLMFTFENLLDLDDRSLQLLVREISGEQLAVALKGTTKEIRALFMRNMSKRAAEALTEDMEMRGPTRLSEVEVAQKEILMTVRRLTDEGQISIGNDDALV
jgi:flagellar motor switch protein FliG